jgi:hypothetical protein
VQTQAGPSTESGPWCVITLNFHCSTSRSTVLVLRLFEVDTLPVYAVLVQRMYNVPHKAYSSSRIYQDVFCSRPTRMYFTSCGFELCLNLGSSDSSTVAVTSTSHYRNGPGRRKAVRLLPLAVPLAVMTTAGTHCQCQWQLS